MQLTLQKIMVASILYSLTVKAVLTKVVSVILQTASRQAVAYLLHPTISAKMQKIDEWLFEVTPLGIVQCVYVHLLKFCPPY